ncbi:sensor histidine kinase [Chryseobacterium ginsengisoli]
MKYNSHNFKETLVIDFLVEDRFRFVRHLLFLIFFFLLIYNASFWHWYSGIYQYYILFFVYVLLIGMVYINIYVLVPLFFFKTRYLTYFILLIFLGVGGLNMIGYCFETFFLKYRVMNIPREGGKGGIYEGVLMCIPIILTTTTVKLLQKWIKDSQRITELNNLTLRMELNELRNQINPHFLFNMLNNVKALIRTDPEKATTVIMKLSEFLRYQLYENGEEKTLLTSEIDFLSNFINLEKIRREDLSVDIHVDIEKRTLNSIFIPPNLFTTFVENAVKHSVDINGSEHYIKIKIKMENEKLYFECINSKNNTYSVSDKNYSGLGLVNIKRRLELLYQNTYELDIISTDKEYFVTLIIPV